MSNQKLINRIHEKLGIPIPMGINLGECTITTSITCPQDMILQHMTHLMDEGIMQFGYILKIMQHNHGKVVNHNTYPARKHLHHALS